MKLKEGIVLGNIDGNDFAIATGKLSKKIKGIINSNESAAFILQLLQTEQSEDSIVEAMCNKYDAPEDVIRTDVRELIEKIKEIGVLD